MLINSVFYKHLFPYFSPKNKSIARLCIDFLVKNIEKILFLKFTELINTSYLSSTSLRLERVGNKKNHIIMSANNNLEQADNIIRNHVIWSMGAGFIPVMVADIFAVSALQLDMIRQMCRVYNVDFQETQGKALVTSLTSTTLARLGAGSIIKLIPGLGSMIGGATVSAFAGASTYALGEVFKKHLESGGTILDFDPERLRKYYKEKFEKGKSVAKEWQGEQTKASDTTFTSTAANPEFKVKEKVIIEVEGEEDDIVPNASAKSDDEMIVPSQKAKTPPSPIVEVTPKPKKKDAELEMAAATDVLIEKIQKLADLKEAGIITEAEFTQMKSRIMETF